jgi:hypothetical protein
MTRAGSGEAPGYARRPVSWEGATRHISLADPAATWTELLGEIEAAPPEDRFAVAVRGQAESDHEVDRLGALIARGYSWRPGVPGELVPEPSRLLSLVASWPEGDEAAAGPSGVSPRHFTHHLMVLQASRSQVSRVAARGAGELWHLDPFLPRRGWAEFIIEFVASRQIDLVHVINAPFAVDLVPALRVAFPTTAVVVDVGGDPVWLTYVTSRYGNVIDAFCAATPADVDQLKADRVSPARIELAEADTSSWRGGLYGRLIATRAGERERALS